MTHSTTASSRRALLLASALFSLCLSEPAHAQPSSGERTLAEALFREGRDLMQEGRHAEACSKFAESQRLDPGGGTLLNLGLCHEQEGKLATAWAELREALAQARAEGRGDRVEIAERHIVDLEPRLPKLEIVTGSVAPDFSLQVDGVVLNRAAWGTKIPLDPGTHVVRAEAPRHVAWEARVEMHVGKLERVEIPALAPEKSKVASAPAPAAKPPEPSRPAPSSSTGRRTTGWVVGGAGLAALGIGTYFGIRAFDLKDQSDQECRTDTTCSDEGVRLNDSALESAWLSNGAIGLGLIGIAVGTYLVLTSGPSRRKESATALQIDLRAAPKSGALIVRRAF